MSEDPAQPRKHVDPQNDDPPGRIWGIGAALALFVALIAVPPPEGLSPAAQRLAATTAVMALLWVWQAIPIAATSLIPLAAYPLLGIQSAAAVSQSYMNANIFLFFGGFMIALGIERWGLHRRLALHVVRLIGGSPRRIVLGFMAATAFLSMWISNTATTLLMLPIALALLSTLGEITDTTPADGRGDESVLPRLGMGLMLGIAYSSSCGGLATLVGTPTNIAFVGQWRELFPEAPQPSMAQWIVVFLPFAVLMLAAVFVALTWRLPRHLGSDEVGRGFFIEQLRGLGRPALGEYAVFVIFATTALLWITREPVRFQVAGRLEPLTLIRGWGPSFEQWLVDRLGAEPSLAHGALHDSTVAMAMALLMFVIRIPVASVGWKPLMDWRTVERRTPWGMLLLFGGGFAMASAFGSTGLSAWLGETLAHSLEGASIPVLVASVCLMMTFLTEFTSNVATVSTLLPVLAGASVTLGIDPRLLMIPATVTASCAFMLPIATPPNAIVFASGHVTMRQMVQQGLLLNLIGVALVTVVTFVLLAPVMGVEYSVLPDWARMPERP
ncbi:MAG: SLC13/DASS family transporter [Planctomycetaceae bacterium]|nr:SLC13/DASS family transporter [Planctomycetaceae bacterium]